MGPEREEVATIPTALRRAATEYGPDEAVVEGGRRVSFSELGGLVDDAARALIAAGVGPGDRVAIWARNSLEWMVASYAVYAVGAVLVPLNTRFKGEEAA